ncbi:MAG: 16S rRNA methyltransferase [Candidatus Helarchaeota archaeon]
MGASDQPLKKISSLQELIAVIFLISYYEYVTINKKDASNLFITINKKTWKHGRGNISLIIILAESALELLPQGFHSLRNVRRKARERNKLPSELLFDKSSYHSLARSLKNHEKRGRPDIIHVSLQLLLGSTLNKSGFLNVFIHTINDEIIRISPETRLPKNYARFTGLMEQLFVSGQVPPEERPLMTIKQQSLKEFLLELKPNKTILFSETGDLTAPSKIFATEDSPEDFQNKKIACIIGGFPHGDFLPETKELADQIISIDPEPLETLTVLSKILHVYEFRINLFRKRIQT